MQHWNPGFVVNLLALAVLLALAAGLRNRIGPLRRLGVPDSIVAGIGGLVLGPSVLNVIPFSAPELESLVYHGFALVFIAVGLQRAPSGARPGGARSVAVAIPTAAVIQVCLGLMIVGGWAAAADGLHPGFALLPMLGFSQGPGQALSLGGAWETLGLADGGQLGLSFAALGFASCCAVGIPVIALARRWGWVSPSAHGGPPRTPPGSERPSTAVMEPLTASVVAIGVVYAGAFALISGLVRILPPGSSLIPTAWGFHFIVGALLAMAVRRGAIRLRTDGVFDDRLLGRLAVLAVDVTTAAALAAVQLAVVGRWWLPVLVITIVVTVVTLIVCLWLGRRAFPQAPFEHAIAMFGMLTGTLPTGLALLRTLDPQLRGPVARNMALGVTGSVLLTAPLMVALLPFAVSLWAHGPAIALGVPLALALVYLVGLGFAWRFMTPLALLRPLRRLWPSTPDP